MSCRTKIKCGNCGRSFYQAYKVDKHVCKESLSILDKFKEKRAFNRTPEVEKFLAEVERMYPADEAAKLYQFYQNWRKW